MTPPILTALKSHCFPEGLSRSTSAPISIVTTGIIDSIMPRKEELAYIRAYCSQGKYKTGSHIESTSMHKSFFLSSLIFFFPIITGISISNADSTNLHIM